jgi:hypothetical protein
VRRDGVAEEFAKVGLGRFDSVRVTREATCVVSGEFGAAAGSPEAGFSETDAD